MYILMVLIATIASIFMIMAVLVQKSKKEGGLDPLAAGSTQLMGITKTTDILEKITWGLAFTITLCAVLSSYYLKKNLNKKMQFYSPNVEVAQNKGLLNQRIPDSTPNKNDNHTKGKHTKGKREPK